MIGAFLLAIQ